MYLSLSMRQSSSSNPERRRQKLKESSRRNYLKSTNNLQYYREIEEQSEDISKFGPVEFYFPHSRESFEKLADIEELTTMLQIQKKAASIKIDYKMNVSKLGQPKKIGNKQYRIENVALFCRQCGPKISMKFFRGATTNYQFKLIYFDNGHHHSKEGSNPLIPVLESSRRFKEVEIKPRETYSKLDWKTLFDDIFQKSKVDPMHYIRHPLYKYLPKFRRIYTNYKFQIMEMRYLSWEHWFEPHFHEFDPCSKLQPRIEAPEDNPDFFMMMHPEMKRNYLRYGDICYLTILDDGIIRKKATYYAGIKFWEMIAFSGLTQENRFAPFCVAFLELGHHQPHSITKVSQYLFNVTNKTPRVIITPNDPFLDEVIEDMRNEKVFRGDHFLDPICELEKIAQTIKSPQQFKYFHELVQCTNPTDFRHHLQELYRSVSPTLAIRKLLEQFLSKSHRMCFGLIEGQTFMGLTFQYSGNKYMNNYYKWNFIEKWEIDIQALNEPHTEYTNKYDLKEFIYMVAHQISRMLERGVCYLENQVKYEIIKYEEFMDLPQLKKVRYWVKYDVFMVILKEYGKSLTLQMRSRAPLDPERPQIATYDIYDSPLKAIFVVSPQPQYDGLGTFIRMRWRCGCLYSYKSGLPCSHEIKVVLAVNSSLYDQIDPYWLCENMKKRPVYNLLRKTHRNTRK